MKTRWAKRPEGDLTYIDGQRDRLKGKLQDAYGMSMEAVERASNARYWG
jgi:uncharacterized protein YjbJ (UPF0337 family)